MASRCTGKSVHVSMVMADLKFEKHLARLAEQRNAAKGMKKEAKPA